MTKEYTLPLTGEYNTVTCKATEGKSVKGVSGMLHGKIVFDWSEDAADDEQVAIRYLSHDYNNGTALVEISMPARVEALFDAYLGDKTPVQVLADCGVPPLVLVAIAESE